MKRFAVILLAVVILPACAKSERGSAAELVKQIATESRPKLRVQVSIRASADEPTAADQTLLRSIEDAVDRKNVGRLVTSGALAGSMFVVVEVENTADAITKLRAILKDAGALPRASFKVIQAE